MSDLFSEKGSVLVTGATGYIGSHLARRLLAEGFDVHIVTRPSSSLNLLLNEINDITVHQHNGSTEELIRILGEVKPQIVFHLASLFVVNHTVENLKHLIDSNILFSTQLVEAMLKVGVKYLINTGTSWQNFSNGDYDPVNLYAATKQAFEDVLRYYEVSSDLRSITLRLSDTYGPDDPRPKLVNLLKLAISTGEPLEMSPGYQKIDLIYIDDVVECFIVASKQIAKNNQNIKGVYWVKSVSPISIREFVNIFSRVSGKSPNVKWAAKPYRCREVMSPYSGSALPGWVQRVSLVDGLKECLNIKNKDL